MGATHAAGARASPGIRLAGCWAHVFRKIDEASAHHPVAREACALIAELYDADLRAGESAAVRAEIRATSSRDVCARLHAWLCNHSGPTSISIYAAAAYTLANWERLTVFLGDSAVPLDNNATERAFRGPVVGRKNYYGAKSRSGTHIAAIFFSLLESCKLHCVHFADYLVAAARAAEDRQTLLPWDFRPGE